MTENIENNQPPVEPPYDPQAAASERPGAVASWVANPPKWILWLFRTLCPIPRLFGWAAVLRYDDVAEVLARSDVFRVPFGNEIARLNDHCGSGTPFILGIDKRDEHDRQLLLVMNTFKRSDVEKFVAKPSFERAREVLGNAPVTDKGTQRIDAIKELITGVPLEICSKYYGVDLPDPQKFAYATIDVSGHLFGLPPIEPKPSINAAAAYVRYVVDRAMDRIPTGDTVLKRLMEMQNAAPAAFTRKHVRAFLIGMIVGFVPTNTMAGGHILEVLLKKKNKAYRERARDAALKGDNDLLQHTLFEAMRFMPLNPGPFRICTHDHVVAADTRRAAKIKKGTKVLASTMSAMFDSRQVDKPGEFNPGRPASDYMLFGYGIHWCVGTFIAQAQITQTFKTLLIQPNLKRASKLQLRGGFPEHLFVEFDPVKR